MKTYSPVPDDWRLGPLSYGLFDDTFMLDTHDIWQGGGYNERCLIAYNYTERFLRQPIGGEIAVPDQPNFLAPEGVHGTTWENASSKYHISYMLASGCRKGDYGTPERVREAGKHAGYGIFVTDFKVSTTTARVTVMNNGIAPIYHSLYVTVNGIRSDTSMKLLAPNETKTYTVTGLSIDLDKLDEVNLTFTSDKLYPDQEVPYDAKVTKKSHDSSSKRDPSLAPDASSTLLVSSVLCIMSLLAFVL